MAAGSILSCLLTRVSGQEAARIEVDITHHGHSAILCKRVHHHQSGRTLVADTIDIECGCIVSQHLQHPEMMCLIGNAMTERPQVDLETTGIGQGNDHFATVAATQGQRQNQYRQEEPLGARACAAGLDIIW